MNSAGGVRNWVAIAAGAAPAAQLLRGRARGHRSLTTPRAAGEQVRGQGHGVGAGRVGGGALGDETHAFPGRGADGQDPDGPNRECADRVEDFSVLVRAVCCVGKQGE